jgi:hypothetical protein
VAPSRASAALIAKNREVFSDRKGVGTGSKVSRTDTISDEALMGSDPGVQFTEGLLEVIFYVREKNVSVFAENLVPQGVESSNGVLGLLVVRLKFFFSGSAVSVMITGSPKVVNADPQRA